jgi:hypothetical protein
MIVKAEHTLNRVILAGAGGGLALIAALFYPLYIDVPGRFVEGWFAGIPAVSLALSVLAVLIIPVTGYVAARWARIGRRAASTLAGALAGWIAALAAYVILVAPAAGVVASDAIFEWGYNPALDDPHALWLTAEPVINILYWTYAALWIMQIGGLALGALGGTFAPASAAMVAAPELRSAAATVAGLVAFVYSSSLLIAPASFGAVETVLNRGSSTSQPVVEAVKPHVFSLPPEGVALIPIGTALALFAVALAVLYWVRASQRRAGDSFELSGGVAPSFAYALLPVWVGVMTVASSSSAYPALTIVTVVVCLGFAALFVAQAIADLRRRQPGEPLWGEWNAFILIPFCVLIVSLVGTIGMAVFIPPYLQYGLGGMQLFIGSLIILVGMLIGYPVYWWFAVRSQGITLAAWIRKQFTPKVPLHLLFSRQWQSTLNVVSAGIPVALVIVCQVVPASLSIVLLVLPAIVVTFAYGQNPLPPEAARMAQTSLAETVRSLYVTHAGALGLVLLVIFVYIGIIVLTMRIRDAFIFRRYARSAEATGQPQSQ